MKELKQRSRISNGNYFPHPWKGRIQKKKKTVSLKSKEIYHDDVDARMWLSAIFCFLKLVIDLSDECGTSKMLILPVMNMRKFSRSCIILLLFFVSSLQSIVFLASEKEILLEFKGNVSDDPFNILKSWIHLQLSILATVSMESSVIAMKMCRRSFCWMQSSQEFSHQVY